MGKALLLLICCFMFSSHPLTSNESRSFSTLEDSSTKSKILYKRESLIREPMQKDSRLGYLESIDQQAIDRLFTGELNLAIEDFSYVLSFLDPEIDDDRNLVASALWGRMLCYAYSDSPERAYDDIQLIKEIFIDPYQCDCDKGLDSSVGITLTSSVTSRPCTLAKYAAPNEKLTPTQCKERVRGTAAAAKVFAMKIRDTGVQLLVIEIIDQLASFGYNCCSDAPEWTQCLNPVVNAWQTLKASWNRLKEMMDNGVALAPYLAGGK